MAEEPVSKMSEPLDRSKLTEHLDRDSEPNGPK